MAKIMHPGHKDSEQNEKQRSSQEYGHVEPLERKPTLQSGIPPRASAHPSALAAVRPKYPRSAIDLERITNFDVARLPTLPQGAASRASRVTSDLTGLAKSGVSERTTDDLTFRNREDLVSIDEIDTFPPEDEQAGQSLGLKKATSEPSTLSDIDTLRVSSLQRKPEEVSRQVERQKLAATQLPTDIGQAIQPQGFSTWRYFDNVCWWLLSPGRLEFLLCLIGGIVLVFLTVLFLLVALWLW